MDVEQMQKINRLAKELMQHGIAPDMEEATKQAELMINKGDNSISEVMRPNSPRVSGSSSSRQEPQRREADDSEVVSDIRKLGNYLVEQGKTIKALKEQLEAIKEDISKLKTMKVQQPVMIKQQFDEQVHLRKEEVKKDEPHPRAGNYNSDDVSIEKFFYSGPK